MPNETNIRAKTPKRSGHSLVYNPYENKVYEINHVNQDINDPDGLKLWLDMKPNTHKSIHYVWDLNDNRKGSMYGREAFWNYRGGRKNIDLYPVYVPNPQRAQKFFEKGVGEKWRYNLLLRNCKDYVIKGLRKGGAKIKQGGVLPGIWKNSPKIDIWDSIEDVPLTQTEGEEQ